jgi:signal transduction histidine kinase
LPWTWFPSFVDVIQYTSLLLFVYFAVSAASELRAQFLAKSVREARLSMVRYVAHDIRAPQSAILTLLDRPGHEDMPSTIKTAIAEQVRRTVALTDAFLWLSKAESSVYRFEPVFLGDVVHEAIDLAWPNFEKKQMTVQREGLDSEDCEIRADREMLVRCIFNLLENAAKYSHQETTVRVVMQRCGNRVSLSMHDQGVGMSPEFVRQAFAEYRRSRNSFGESGFGLGLAFVATVVEQHGAVIDCHSQPGQGSTFVLQFDSDE